MNIFTQVHLSTAMHSVVLAAESENKEIVFHCMKSQVRGPHCARMLFSKLAENKNPNAVKV